ncbi:hypothetical protein [Bradyrhizobium diazoefficiens]|uniref:Uncharacterized protein n=1 Tax=Bradyrhizobium diazoefficiens TaxID=1355477 RepID=A0A810C768_9BRAD|nr:hypothetical protein XF9B_52000 [Bradyrhizobium diazoefficiens]BCF01322.1 hypothetical protein XF11B_53420 [Bradyrhizobium diazoefficiens]BCF09862.1 hypothetical protein XF12B_52350 [Bradyrhizobium diazoefficiens]BCF62357.1 hypothetical protein XF18B_53050 [Bradyrhizobium diazoefficiens]
MSTTVTLKAVQRRFERSHNYRSKICTLAPRERQGMHGSRFALVKDNTAWTLAIWWRRSAGAEMLAC